MRPGRRLGVDAGQARVGVATCDPDAILATPLATLDRREATDEEVASAIVRMAREHEAIEIILGLPLHMSGREGEAARAARELGAAIVRCGAPAVRLLDERLTTVQAQAHLREAGRPARRQRPVVDQAAAVVILQAALDAERGAGGPPGQALALDFRASSGTDERPASE